MSIEEVEEEVMIQGQRGKERIFNVNKAGETSCEAADFLVSKSRDKRREGREREREKGKGERLAGRREIISLLKMRWSC